MTHDLVIDQVSWHTQTAGNPESREQILARFNALRTFLHQNSLTAGELGGVGDGFALRAGDLTEEGLALMKFAYDKWLRRLDRGADPADVSPLNSALRKLRQAG